MALSVSTTLITTFLMYCGYYLLYYGKKPQLYKKDKSKFSVFLQKYVPALNQPFWSLFFLPGGRFQTVVATLLPNFNKLKYSRTELIRTPDGGQFSFHWAYPSGVDDPARPLAIIFPGLTSHSGSRYIELMVRKAMEMEMSAVVMVNRGVDSPILTPKAFCAADCNDFRFAIDTIRDRFPGRAVIGAGVSMGGLILSRYLSFSSHDCKLKAAFVYACPFNPVEGSANLERWPYWLLYNVSITQNLKSLYNRSADKFVGVIDHHRLRRSSSIREFDANFTSKIFGYKTVDHYYEDSMITPKLLHSIRTPMLCLCANDDAFVPIECQPKEAIAETDYVVLGVTRGGGHVGHLQGLNPFKTPYFIDVFGEFLSAVTQHSDELPAHC